MTFDDYIKNPMGLKNAAMSNRSVYETLYIQKLDKILLREAGNIKYFLFKDNENYIAHMKIPSEVVPGFFYDTVIKFVPPKGILPNSLDKYETFFYSNDPSFVFTFAHAFLKGKMFMTELSPKMSKKAISEKADIRNPKNIIGYVKSLYFAYIIMRYNKLFNKDKYTLSYNLKTLLSNVMQADEKISKRQELGEKIRKESKDQQSQNVNRSVVGNIAHNIENKIANTKLIKTVSKVKNIKTTKKIK